MLIEVCVWFELGEYPGTIIIETENGQSNKQLEGLVRDMVLDDAVYDGTYGELTSYNWYVIPGSHKGEYHVKTAAAD